MPTENTLLSVCDVSTFFNTGDGVAKAVQNVSFDINASQTVALVGESGCGKSVTALSIMQLVPKPAGKIVSGKIFFENKNLLELSEKQMRKIRGNKIGMIFQEPMTSLNPVFTVGDQIAETICLHQKKSHDKAWQMAEQMLEKVGIPEPARRLYEYPHLLSGGMRQRVMIAMAISCQPALLIADEPTTALDVTIQAQILDLLDELQASEKMSILLITHDLGVVAQRADYVAVMYASRIVEKCHCAELFNNPLHPYTKGLLKSLPQLGTTAKRLETIGGNVPEPLNFPTGCKFHPRCPIGCNDKKCQTQEPELKQVSENHYVACWYAK
ncbi:MAG TPA: peptide ABC transporter ATP-binding protein [Phycisphaerales bacterium]|nr:MAG: peptide ABC transporter ATP-binding protein [Planctomycetes bacterium GWC2_45_44]HBG78681.1 peptide ABC transporter ATP-binding protein [Phycisphaerales bacterium]HBR20049.1 peptide ABC transporter ATP-binding protein [Phycisphaerales bacterium]